MDCTDQRGFSVASLKWDELPILPFNRMQLEALALHKSIDARNATWEDSLVLLSALFLQHAVFTV